MGASTSPLIALHLTHHIFASSELSSALPPESYLLQRLQCRTTAGATMSLPRVVPWRDWAEWQLVYAGLYAQQPEPVSYIHLTLPTKA